MIEPSQIDFLEAHIDALEADLARTREELDVCRGAHELEQRMRREAEADLARTREERDAQLERTREVIAECDRIRKDAVEWEGECERLTKECDEEIEKYETLDRAFEKRIAEHHGTQYRLVEARKALRECQRLIKRGDPWSALKRIDAALGAGPDTRERGEHEGEGHE